MGILNKVKNQLIKIKDQTLNLFLRGPLKTISTFLRSPLFSLILFIGGNITGFITGARVFETGNYKLLKGATVKLSGPCRVEGEVRRPSLAEDEVKIVSITNEKLIGVVRATRETVECDIADTAIDALPLLKDFTTSPAVIPEIKPFQPVLVDEELIELRKKTIRASGTCEGQGGEQLPSFIDQDIEVINAERAPTDKTIIKIQGIMRKGNQSVLCTNKTIKYRVLDPVTGTPVTVATEVQRKKDLVGEIILITSTCFPDKRIPQSQKSKIVFYPLVNARMQVTQNMFDDEGKLSYVAGAIIENGAMVECDQSKYPISYKTYDPNGVRLEKINTQDKADELESGKTQ